MRFAILSDVHANLDALTVVLAALDEARVDALVCLGDLVGYHSEPNECIDLLAARGARIVAGNHDLAAIGALDPGGFGAAARTAIVWTRDRLTERSRRFLQGLPIVDRVDDAFVLVHGALHPQPNVRLHLSTQERVYCSLERLAVGRWNAPLGFFGHTHVPVVHELRRGAVSSHPLVERFALREDARYLVNPGSVGQPRDSDPRASFVVYDAARRVIEPRRVAYDVGAVERKTLAAGIAPSPVGDALSRVKDRIETVRAGALHAVRRISQVRR